MAGSEAVDGTKVRDEKWPAARGDGNSEFAVGHLKGEFQNTCTEFPQKMKLSLLSKRLIQGVFPGVLVATLAFPASIFAQASEPGHLVSPEALQQKLETKSATRQQEIKTVTEFLSSPVAERAMKDSHINPEQVRTAIPTLSDQELANLSTRAADAQQKFAAGSFSNNELIIIILIVALVIVVIALVH